MTLKIQVAHDFICPWCWVGLFQAKRLVEEFGVEIEWKGYELFPDHLEWPDYSAAEPPPANKPSTPTRFEFLLAAENMEMPGIERPHKMRTHNAHEALEFAIAHGKGMEFCEALYRAYWEKGANINTLPVLINLACEHGLDPDDLAEAVTKKQFAKNIIGFDDPAHAVGVYNVPTFFIGKDRLAEQPYQALAKAVQEIQEFGENTPYAGIKFPPAPADQPYVSIDMVATIDGKIVSGEPGEPVWDLGSENDHNAMKRLEALSDAVLVGAGTLRSSGPTWKPKSPFRFVITKSGHLDGAHKFFEGPGSFLVVPGSATVKPPQGVGLLRAGGEDVDPTILLSRMKAMGIHRLLILGGSETNALFMENDLVDEIFLTISPKIKMGKGLPGIVGGNPLDRSHLQDYTVVEHHRVGDELFLRYRRKR